MRKAPFRTLLHDTNITQETRIILDDSRFVSSYFPHGLHFFVQRFLIGQ